MNMQNLLKQAQKMQKEIGKVEKELKEKEYTVTLGGEAVKVTVKGNLRVQSIDIDEELLEKENKEDLIEMLTAAVNEALTQAETEKEKALGSITGGVKLPGGF